MCQNNCRLYKRFDEENKIFSKALIKDSNVFDSGSSLLEILLLFFEKIESSKRRQQIRIYL